jgi:Uma2 family endonuclease
VSDAAHVSVDQYLRRTEKPLCEYIDGILVPKPFPTRLHAFVQFRLVTRLRRLGLDALAEVTVPVSPTRYRVADVIADRRITDPCPTNAVKLCAEILSPQEGLSSAFAKCEDYQRWGVPYCWVIDSVKRTGWEYHAGTDPVKIEAGGSLRAGEIALLLSELFSEPLEFQE